MKLFRIILSIVFATSISNLFCQSEFENDLDKFSYSIGLNLGKNLSNEQLDTINADLLAKAVLDVLKDNELKISQSEALRFINFYLRSHQYQNNITESEKFLKENSQKKGIKTTDSGLQYEILVKGKGKKPKETDTVKVHYHGTLLNGKVFDSSVERGEPLEFPVKGVIKGWQEVLQLMPVGSRWKVYIPAELAYGDNPRPGGDIEPFMALIFEMELIEITSKEDNK